MSTAAVCRRCSAPLYLEPLGARCFGCGEHELFPQPKRTTAASVERFLKAMREH